MEESKQEEMKEKEDLNEDEDNSSDVEEENEQEEKALDEHEETIKKLQEENKEQYERMLRIQAEFDNYKRRTQQERINERKYQVQSLAEELLPVLDNFERALQVEVNEQSKGIYEGIKMVYNQLLEALKSNGVEPIDVVGKQFDPNLHHAVMQIDDDQYKSNEIVEELQKGYMLKDRVLRPSMVKVNK